MTSTDEHLAKAKTAIAVGERSMREAADHIAAAQAQGATQRAIAATVGKSPSWVNRLLAWRTGGFIGDAFGPAHHRERRLSAFPPGKQTDEQAPGATRDDFIEEQLRADEIFKARQERIEAGTREAEQIRADARARFNFLDLYVHRVPAAQERDRRILVKALGLLGSNQQGDVQNAVRVIETQRHKLDMTWDELIVPAAIESEQDLAA